MRITFVKLTRYKEWVILLKWPISHNFTNHKMPEVGFQKLEMALGRDKNRVGRELRQRFLETGRKGVEMALRQRFSGSVL